MTSSMMAALGQMMSATTSTPFGQISLICRAERWETVAGAVSASVAANESKAMTRRQRMFDMPSPSCAVPTTAIESYRPVGFSATRAISQALSSNRCGWAGVATTPAPPPHLLLVYRQTKVWAATSGAPVERKTSCSDPPEFGFQLSPVTEWLDVSPGATMIGGSAIVTEPRLSVRIHAYDTEPPVPLVVNVPVAMTVPFRHDPGFAGPA